MNTTHTTKTRKSLSLAKRVTRALAVSSLLITVLTSCSMANGGNEPLVTNSVDDSKSVLKSLDEADSITAKKAVLAFGDRWTVSADGVEVGEVRGQAIYLIGDTYSLFSNAGNLVGSEAEGYRVVHNRAETYDYNNQPRGEIKQTFSMFLSKYEIKDTDDVVIGTAEQKLNLTMDFDVLGKDREVDYKISKSMLSLGANLTVEKKNKDSAIEAIDALWLAVIASEVEEAKSTSKNQ